MAKKILTDRDAMAIWSLTAHLLPEEPDPRDVKTALAKGVGLYLGFRMALEADPVEVCNQDGDVAFTVVEDEAYGFAVEY
jgi:hypothetical protein